MGFVPMLNCIKNPEEPMLVESWEVITKEVTLLDDGLVGGWKEDIDTLLVFAGLFSAVVTAFTIESYQWLQEAPEDTTVALLKQISQQMNGTSVPEPDMFSVSSSDVAINVLWFLSLIIALVDALFALLCKQWLREHRRHIHTRTPGEALALRWLRNQSLEKWHVPAILASLPMLLELALFLFLAGLLELLRTRHPVPFAIATIVVAFAAIFYFGTTIIPTVDIARQALQVTSDLRSEKDPGLNHHIPSFFIMTLPPMEYICPYRSPQAWVAFQSSRLLSRIFSPLGRAPRFLLRRGYITVSTHNRLVRPLTLALTFGQITNNLLNWSSVDLELLRRADIDLAPPFYMLNAFRWLVSELRDSPHMITHLRKVLSTVHPHLVMPVVFGQWFFLPGRKWTVGDIKEALAVPEYLHSGWSIDHHLTWDKRRFLAQSKKTRLFNRLLHWIHVSMNVGDKGTDGGRDSPDLFPIPFRSVDAMPDDVRNKRAHLWNTYTKIAQDPAVPDCYWKTLMEDWVPYIIASSPNYALHLPTATTASQFVGSADGCDLLSRIHSHIIERKLFENAQFWEKNGAHWMEVVDILRRVHPKNDFEPIPGHFPLPLSMLKKTLEDLLSPIDPVNDFQYMDEFRRGWGDANNDNKEELVAILSEHIIDYGAEYDVESSHHSAGRSTISPIVMSSAGLELIAFVNDHLAEESETYEHLDDWIRDNWRDAIEQVRAAHPELPPEHFKNIFHEGVDSSTATSCCNEGSRGVEAQAGDSGDSPRDVTNAGEVGRNEINGRSPISATKLAPQPEPGELDERRPNPLDDGDTNEKGSIPMQPIVTGDLATGSGGTSSVVQGEGMVGGPDADKNV
ncbi:hypothetical protein PQX77_017664 [Marasmius sp. AFHP31]|nr:hypothetical protein PQX77_017664 [Marasmius sp. AFHP31]